MRLLLTDRVTVRLPNYPQHVTEHHLCISMMLSAFLVLLSICRVHPARGASLYDRAKTHHDWIRDIRRELHKYPEIGFSEHKTSEMLRGWLKELDIPFQCDPDPCRLLQVHHTLLPLRPERRYEIHRDRWRICDSLRPTDMHRAAFDRVDNLTGWSQMFFQVIQSTVHVCHLLLHATQ